MRGQMLLKTVEGCAARYCTLQPDFTEPIVRVHTDMVYPNGDGVGVHVSQRRDGMFAVYDNCGARDMVEQAGEENLPAFTMLRPLLRNISALICCLEMIFTRAISKSINYLRRFLMWRWHLLYRFM